ncbi:hypothetical protein [Microcella alkaliphila]|uniref:Putative secreted protein n=1 Tax=Microcella alkaliphila TaxID=279828 RepID=A0A0U5BPH6_9MICO|nr:hypothetical protein [Microcella alkaliphila]BAU33461.1 putative secreted protein [Microcella alkaliphila]
MNRKAYCCEDSCGVSALAAVSALIGGGIVPGDEQFEGSDLVVVQPTTVTVIGDLGLEAGETIPVAELVEAASELDQDIAASLPLLDVGVERLAGFGLAAHPVAPLVGVAGQGVVSSSTSPAYRIVSTWRDGRNARNAVRAGSSTWGWAHVQKHNVSMAMIQKTTKFPRFRTVSGTSTTYRTPANTYVCWLTVCRIDKSVMVRVVHEDRMLSDGQPRGMITTYCEISGTKVCPNWVREVAG